jgi:hypothetical protein
MTYQLQNLDVSSLDFDDIKTSLVSFFKQQPDLSDLDFDNQASTTNLLINILATVTAYNGIYSQFGYVNSFATTTTLLQSLLGIAANSSVLITPTQGASTTGSISTSGITLQEYSTFLATSTNGANLYFFNIDSVKPNTNTTLTLYSGSQVVSYTNYDYKTQSCQLPYTVDPRTIKFYTAPLNSSTVTTWTRVDQSATASSGNQNTFTVINGPEGYIVTNNFPSAQNITTASTVLIKAVVSNGVSSNNSSLIQRPDVSFLSSTTPTGGYDQISVDRARYQLLFNATGQNRCVTINDFINAILSSGLDGTGDSSLITVQNDPNVPGLVKIYVLGLSDTNQSLLMNYLGTLCVAGITLTYSL